LLNLPGKGPTLAPFTTSPLNASRALVIPSISTALNVLNLARELVAKDSFDKLVCV
jgi:hypothetical protein